MNNIQKIQNQQRLKQIDKKQKNFHLSAVTPTNQHQQQKNKFRETYSGYVSNKIQQQNKVQTKFKKDYFKSQYNKLTSQTAKSGKVNQDKNKNHFPYFRNQKEYKPLSPTVTGARSQGKLYKRPDLSPQHTQNPKIKEKQGIKKEYTEYQKLHDKLNYLEVKITQMKLNLQKKRQEKKKFLETQQKQKQKRQEQQKKKRQEKVQKKAPNDALKDLITQVPQHKQLHVFNFNPYSPRHNLYYVSEIVRAYKQEKSLAREHVLSSMHILKVLQNSKMPTKEQLSSKCVKIQRKSFNEGKKTIVFDLDETLIHCNENINVPYDVKIPIKFPTGEIIEAGINIRPHSMQLIRSLSKNFQIIVFTASHACYANVVLNHLDPENKYIHHRLFRDNCYATPEGMYVKDLRVINRDLSEMVLVDNAAYSYAFQIDNGIPIIPYYEGKIDYELKALHTYLQSLLLVKDVRQINRKTFKIAQYRKYDTIEHLVKQLYYEEMR